MKTEKYVRAVAGSMVLASVGAGYWIHAGWFFLTAFVAANLLQSAFTGFCPLEKILKAHETRAARSGDAGCAR